MPRLQILQHKSYHPYLEKNKQRVREDEARAAAEELEREQKQVDTEAQARLTALRRRAGSPSFQEEDEDNLPSTSTRRDKGDGLSLLEKHKRDKAREEKRERKKRDRLDFDFPSETARRSKGKERAEREALDEEDKTWQSGGHVNLFADLEKEEGQRKPALTPAELAKQKKDQEKDPFTMYLGRPEKETKPWYTDRDLRRVEDKETGEEAEERRARERRKDARSKNRHDPLTQITSMLSTSARSSKHRTPVPSRHHPPQRPSNPSEARKAREMSERERALALIAKSKAPTGSRNIWDDTPSSVGRTWEDDWERQKAKAGNRFYNGLPPNGRSWEV
ncbi:hypothetical protein IAU60_002949 [Kwoniella sp. DSM 27419]